MHTTYTNQPSQPAIHQEQDRPSGGGQGGVSSSNAVLDQASMLPWYRRVRSTFDLLALMARSTSSFID